MPLNIRLTGSEDQTTGAFREGGRRAVFDAIRQVEAFSRLVVDDTRIIAPGHGLDSGLFAEDYLAPYIDEVWSTHTGRDLKVTTNAGTSTGRVRGDRFTFDGPAQVSFGKPSTRDVLFCDGALAAPNDGTTGPVAAVLGAGFNRSTLLSHPDQPTTDASVFTGPSSPTTTPRPCTRPRRTGRRTASPSTTSPTSPPTSRTRPPPACA